LEVDQDREGPPDLRRAKAEFQLSRRGEEKAEVTLESRKRGPLQEWMRPEKTPHLQEGSLEKR